VRIIHFLITANIRADSAGKGMHNGGEGVIRDIEFLEPIQCSILSERRVHPPNGIEGGSNAACGRNTWVKQRRKEDGDLREGVDAPRIISLGGKQTVAMGAHDRIVIRTPGGGGYGKAGEERRTGPSRPVQHQNVLRGSHADRGAMAEGSS
jgi:N-methylhydantoinase B/oxoprolinase/acetone carboxylase alpha subunit